MSTTDENRPWLCPMCKGWQFVSTGTEAVRRCNDEFGIGCDWQGTDEQADEDGMLYYKPENSCIKIRAAYRNLKQGVIEALLEAGMAAFKEDRDLVRVLKAALRPESQPLGQDLYLVDGGAGCRIVVRGPTRKFVHLCKCGSWGVPRYVKGDGAYCWKCNDSTRVMTEDDYRAIFPETK